MASILDLYGKSGPKTAQIDKKGKDKTPIGTEFPFVGSADLIKNNSRLEKARGGKVNNKIYSTTVKK
jgi:hypothetical protein